jgi:sulfite reductase (ferredoxin)
VAGQSAIGGDSERRIAVSETPAVPPVTGGATPARTSRPERPLTWEEVRKRNYVERIKHEKFPYDLAAEFDRLAATPYEEIPEEDMLRFQWWGLYHDKPKVGFMMMRIKLPNGLLTPQKLRAIGELSRDFGRSYGEITTRQDIQLHWIRIADLPQIFPRLEAAGLTTKGGCGDVLRNITGCPVAGIDAEELFDATPVVLEAHRRFSGNPQYGNLPRKHKWTISACPYHCNAPEIHDVALVGTIQDGVPGFAVWVGGGLSTVPRIAKPLGVFVTLDEALEVPRAVLEIWSNDLKYRMSRAKARFKFMVDDYGPEKLREMIENHLGRKLTDLKVNPQPKGRTDHLGVHPQKQPGKVYIGVPVFPGILRAEQMLAIADIAEEIGAEIRLTREQNLILVHVPEKRTDETLARLQQQAGLSLAVNPIRGHSIGCTGEPHCNFSVGETKTKLVEIVEHLEQQFGPAIADLRIYLDGCPHACGQHWVGDIGIQGTTLTTSQGKVEAYDVLLRGGLGQSAAIGKAVLRRVPGTELKFTLERLVRAWLVQRQNGETLQQFFTRLSDEQIQTLARGEPSAPNLT